MKVFRVIGEGLVILMLGLLMLAGMHIGGKRKPKQTHGTLVLADNFMHLGKCLIFLVLLGIFLLLVLL